MSNKNELIEVIDSSCTSGFGVKSIRKQKYDPCNFYMTRTDGKQIGPVKCQGSVEDLARKFSEAQSHLEAMKTSTHRRAA
jgi:hypothetical protein